MNINTPPIIPADKSYKRKFNDYLQGAQLGLRHLEHLEFLEDPTRDRSHHEIFYREQNI